MLYTQFVDLAEQQYQIRESRKASKKGYNPTPHPDIDIIRPYDDNSSTKIYHKPSGVTYSISHHGKYHNIAWNHTSGSPDSLSRKERINIARNAEHVWKNHVEPGFSPGHVLSNEPITNNGKKAREQVYSRYGFSSANKHGMQFAKVGKDRAEGRSGRLTPYSPNKVQRAVIAANREMK